jgi:hypothetical protein
MDDMQIVAITGSLDAIAEAIRDHGDAVCDLAAALRHQDKENETA